MTIAMECSPSSASNGTGEPSRFPEHLAGDLLAISRDAATRVAGFDDEDLIDALASDICDTAIRRWHTYKPEYSLSTWINQIAIRRHIDFQRKNGREDRQLGRLKETLKENATRAKPDRSRGNPRGLSDAQKFGLLKLAQEHSLNCQGVHRLLKLDRTARETLGFRKTPWWTTIYRAMRWAKEQG